MSRALLGLGRKADAIVEFICDSKLAAYCAANGLRYATEHFSFDKMMEAKLRADLALGRGSVAGNLTSAGCAEQRASPR